MNTLIKGMNVPKSGQTITIVENPDGTLCGRLESTGELCPITFIPPHGRLIDANALLDDCIFSDKGLEKFMYEFIGDAPTVVEADNNDGLGNKIQ